jgi:hypothetical protein
MMFVVVKVELAKGPLPRAPEPREGLWRFVRHVEATEKKTLLHTEHNVASVSEYPLSNEMIEKTGTERDRREKGSRIIQSPGLA